MEILKFVHHKRGDETLPIIVEVGKNRSHVEISVGIAALLVAQTKAVGAVPEHPPPPAVRLCGAPIATQFPPEDPAVLVFYIFISSVAERVL